MKTTVILFATLFLASCSKYSKLATDSCCIRKPDSKFTVRYGDDRFHNDGELIDEVYYVYGKDTVHVFTKQRVRNSNPTKYVK